MNRRVIAGALAMWLTSQPLISLACLAAATPEPGRSNVGLSAAGGANPGAARASESDPARRPHAAESANQRGAIAERLVELGSPPAEAQALALQLTPADLAVLLGNPKMMQAAGEMDEQTENIMWGLLILGGIIAVAAASEGSVSIN